MPRARRLKMDTAAGAVAAMQNAIAGIFAPPAEAELEPADMVYWAAIVRARARDEWTENDLQVAAQLARCRRQIQEEEKLLKAEGRVIENQRGTPIMNPRVTVIEQLSRRQMALMRSIQCTATATAGYSAHNVGRRRAAREAEAAATIEADDLLA